MIITLVIYFACIFITGRYGNAGILYVIGIMGLAGMPSYAAASIRLTTVLIIMLFISKLIKQTYFFTRKRKSFIYGLFLGGYMILYAIITTVINLKVAERFQNRCIIAFSCLYFMLVGVTEKLVFRGITADLLLRMILQKEKEVKKQSDDGMIRNKAIYAAVIISGLIFAGAHAINIQYADISGVLVQMAGAFVMGMFLTAVYYRTGNIYSVMILHVMNDLAAALPVTIIKSKESVADIISGYGAADLLQMIPYLVILIFLIRPQKQEEITGLWDTRGNSSEAILS